MKYICSLFVVEDIGKAKHFYADILGQHITYDYGESVNFEGGFAIHKRDHYQKLVDDIEIKQGSNSFELYFEDDDLEVLQKKLNGYGIEFIHGIKEQPWKQKVIRFYDYDRNIVEVGERLEHVAYRLYKERISSEEIEKITYLDRAKIEMAIKEYSEKEFS